MPQATRSAVSNGTVAVELRPPRRPRRRRAVELDRADPDVDHVPRLADPRQPHDVAARLAEEDLLERRALASLPRSSTCRTMLHGEPGSSSSYRMTSAVASPDRSTSSKCPWSMRHDERAVADAVRRPAAGDRADHPARADRLAVARLEVRAGDPPGHDVVSTPTTSRTASAVFASAACSASSRSTS